MVDRLKRIYTEDATNSRICDGEDGKYTNHTNIDMKMETEAPNTKTPTTPEEAVNTLNTKIQTNENADLIEDTFEDLSKLPKPYKFSTALDNCEKVLECVITISKVGLKDKINEHHIKTMGERCLVPKRKTAYYEAKAMWLEQDELYVTGRGHIITGAGMNPRRASLEDREPAAPTADTRLGGIGDITQPTANLQTETSTK